MRGSYKHDYHAAEMLSHASVEAGCAAEEEADDGAAGSLQPGPGDEEVAEDGMRRVVMM